MALAGGGGMLIRNVTRDAVLADHAWVAKTRAQKGKGLLGLRGLAVGQGLVLEGTKSIHTMFMAFPIDVAFFDSNRRVAHIVGGMGPWRISRIVLRAAGVVELPAGTLGATGTQVGDQLGFLAEGSRDSAANE